MEQPITGAARRTEDIALDLLKFIASTTNVVKSTGGGTPGFAGTATPKSDDQVAALLELYGRCRQAVEAK
ncbi:hypothetical protein [Terriglobus sp. TAA 43]|uniref:hypothetical protein n=1 Tax=Terriglobus sp. TAA 43 TaxID=278961 RepID=UPI000647535E|nr:hypothetical protein [Terriglobus sp. TAA 43]